jgi:hypothetical protein
MGAVVNSIHGAALAASVSSSSSSQPPTPISSPTASSIPSSSPPATAGSSTIWSLFGSSGGSGEPKSPIPPVASPSISVTSVVDDSHRVPASPPSSKRSLPIASSTPSGPTVFTAPVTSVVVVPSPSPPPPPPQSVPTVSGFGRFLGSLAAVGKSGIQAASKKIAEQTEIKPESRVFVVDGKDDFLSLSELRITSKSTITLLGGVRLTNEAATCVMYRTGALLAAASSDHFMCVQCDLKFICAQCVVSCHQGTITLLFTHSLKPISHSVVMTAMM